MDSFLRRPWRWLASPRATMWLLGLTFVLTLPSLGTGFALDDHILAHSSTSAPPWALFEFFGPNDRASKLEQGMCGWWADPSLELRFFRPLASMLHALDFRLWADTAWPMHLGSALLYVALVGVAAGLYRRLLGAGAVAGLASLLFAVDDTHAQAVGWLSNRSLVLGTLVGFGALWAHDRWRRDGWRPGVLVGPVLLLVALTCAEASLSVMGYLVAHALCLDRGRVRSRVAALAPYLVVVIGWRVAIVSMGYGATGSGIYRDPQHDPLGVLAAIAPTVGNLGLSQLTVPLTNSINATPSGGLWALLAMALLMAWILPLLRREPAARFCALGMLLAAMPYATTLPSERLLLPLGLGGAGLVAMVIAAAASTDPGAWRPRWTAAIARVLHVWISLVLFIPSLLAVRLLDTPAQRLADTVVDAANTRPATSDPVVVMVNVPFEVLLLYPGSMVERTGRSWPPHVYPLFAGRSAITLRRVGDDVIEVEAERSWMGSPLNRFSRDPSHPMAEGERIELEAMVVEVLDVNGPGRPTRIRVTFDRPLEALVWVAWVDGAPVVWPAPDGTHALTTEFSF